MKLVMYFLSFLYCGHFSFNLIFLLQFKTLSHEIIWQKDSRTKIRGLKKITQILEVLQKKVKKLKTLWDDSLFIWPIKYLSNILVYSIII